MQFSRFLLALSVLALARASAQLELPEWTEAEESSDRIHVPAPEATKKIEGAVLPPAPMVPNNQLRINFGGGGRVLFGAAVDDDGPAFDPRTIPHLPVALTTTQQQVLHGTVFGQPILVESAIGSVAVSLTELRSLERLNATEMRAHTRSGDQVRGRVLTRMVEVVAADGSRTQVPQAQWERLVFPEAAPAVSVPPETR